ncbi:MAG: phosphotransferase [Micrococcales bacterium]|nr:phosphotransferase [Micrococcales bacterium]
MARTPFTLAALATSAVAGLDVVGAAPYADDGFDSAVIADRDGRTWVIRVPRSAAAEAEQSADLVALGALTGGVRSRLPFAITGFAGQAPVEGTRAVVLSFVDGSPSPTSSMGPELAASVGAAIAAIHALPTSCVTEVGLPSLGPVHAHQTSTTLVDRAVQTGLLPAALRERWEHALLDDQLWQFQPTVVNGALGSHSVLSDGVAVTGILGWHELRVADPALDLAWLFSGRRTDAADGAFATYLHARPGADRQLAARATFYGELETAKWLLHGTETRDQAVVDDAVQLLHGLVDDIQDDRSPSLGAETAPILALRDVEALLDRVERVS